jgi:hypothetical protein
VVLAGIILASPIPPNVSAFRAQRHSSPYSGIGGSMELDAGSKRSPSEWRVDARIPTLRKRGRFLRSF